MVAARAVRSAPRARRPFGRGDDAQSTPANDMPVRFAVDDEVQRWDELVLQISASTTIGWCSTAGWMVRTFLLLTGRGYTRRTRQGSSPDSCTADTRPETIHHLTPVTARATLEG